MPQFRLTEKFARDLKVSTLQEPTNPLLLLDDWFVDVIRIDRKKVAMVTHVDSRLTFLLPYVNIGGASSVPACTGVLLAQFLIENDLSEQAEEAERLFEKPLIFCKTQDRSVLGHMNELKRCIGVMIYHAHFEDIDWDNLIGEANDIPLRMPNGKYIKPAELFLERILNTDFHGADKRHNWP